MERQFSDLIILLAGGINQRRMYFDDHPKVQAVCHEFTTRLRGMIDENGRDEFAFGVYGGKFIRQGKYLVGPSIAGRSLIEFAERLGCGGFSFHLPLAMVDVATFFRLGAAQKEKLANLEEARALFAANGIDHIELAVPFREEGDLDESDGHPESTAETDFMAADFAPLLDVYQALYETVSTNNLSISRNDDVDMAGARASGEKLAGVSDMGAMDVMQFMRYPDYDSYTIGHSVRVAALSSMVGRELGWSPEILAELATAGLVHDLGKGRVPEEILFKTGKLNPDEMKIIKSHPATGAQILMASGEQSPLIIASAWGHHIREDGGGYPVMPEWYVHGSAASLIHVCDVFEALTAVRPYKAPMTPRRAFEIMLKDEGGFQPRILAALIRAMGLYPPGSEVVLSDSRKAVVVARGKDMDCPLVRVTHDPEGLPIARSDQPAIQLECGDDLEVAEFLMVGIAEENQWRPRQDDDLITCDYFS
ncbi:MAG: HD-GYP domain-containing protein [Candidatus Krumholzibacteriota bacterium]